MPDTGTNTVAKTTPAKTKKPRAKRGEGVYKTSLYHVFKIDGKSLVPLKDVQARNAKLAAASLVEKDPKLAGQELRVVPDRNLKTFKFEVETKTKVTPV